MFETCRSSRHVGGPQVSCAAALWAYVKSLYGTTPRPSVLAVHPEVDPGGACQQIGSLGKAYGLARLADRGPDVGSACAD